MPYIIFGMFYLLVGTFVVSILNMSAIQDLRDAVSADMQSKSEELAKLADAMRELAEDIGNIPNSADVEAEVARVKQSTADTATALDGVAQGIKDAIPTAPVED